MGLRMCPCITDARDRGIPTELCHMTSCPGVSERDFKNKLLGATPDTKNKFNLVSKGANFIGLNFNSRTKNDIPK